MASLNELKTIYVNATTFVDSAVPTQAELDAHALLDRCEAHLWRLARGIFGANDDSPDLRNFKIAMRVAVDSRELARRMLLLLLGSPAAESATVAQIVASNDATVATAIDTIAGRFALALVQPGSR